MKLPQTNTRDGMGSYHSQASRPCSFALLYRLLITMAWIRETLNHRVWHNQKQGQEEYRKHHQIAHGSARAEHQERKPNCQTEHTTSRGGQKEGNRGDHEASIKK